LAILKDGKANAPYVTALGEFPNLSGGILRSYAKSNSSRVFLHSLISEGKEVGADSGSANRFAILLYAGVFQVLDSDSRRGIKPGKLCFDNLFIAESAGVDRVRSYLGP
jgi:hypothetical protein